MTSQTLILYDFSAQSNPSDWKIVDDVVMGGHSNGNFFIDKSEHGIFEGNISLEDNGGFSMVKHQFDHKKISGFNKVVLKIKGDGKAYQFRIKTRKSDRHAYIGNFSTTGTWETISILFSDMYPAYRGKKLNTPQYSGEGIEEIAFLIGNKKAENFKLEIDSIILY